MSTITKATLAKTVKNALPGIGKIESEITVETVIDEIVTALVKWGRSRNQRILQRQGRVERADAAPQSEDRRKGTRTGEEASEDQGS